MNREAVWPSKYNNGSSLYQFITALNVFRSRAISVANTITNNYLTYKNFVIYNDTNTLVMRKGYNGTQVITVLNNDGIYGKPRTITLPAGIKADYAAGEVVTDIISCKNTTVDTKGNLKVEIKEGLPIVFYSAQHLVGTTICFNGTTTNPNSVSQNPPHGTASGLFGAAEWQLYFAVASSLAMSLAGCI
jgi:alpha-amylase